MRHRNLFGRPGQFKIPPAYEYPDSVNSATFGQLRSGVREAVGAVTFVRRQQIRLKNTGWDGCQPSLAIIDLYWNRTVGMIFSPTPSLLLAGCLPDSRKSSMGGPGSTRIGIPGTVWR